MSGGDLRARREAVVREHMESEDAHDVRGGHLRVVTIDRDGGLRATRTRATRG